MTTVRAQRIMQLDVRCLISERGRFCYGAFDGDPLTPLVRAEGSTPGEALERLVQRNYERVCRIVFERQGWKCNHCGRMKPLQAHHHPIPRARGRLDVEGNLEGW